MRAYAQSPAKPAPVRPEAVLSVGVLLWPRFPLMSLSGIVESLRHAGDHGDASEPRYARWDIVGPHPGRTVSSCGITVATTASYTNPSAFDYLFVIGGLLSDIETAPAGHRAYLRAAVQAGAHVIGVCTGSFVLAQEGLLDRRTVCLHPYHQRDFEMAFPRLRTVVTRNFELTDQVSTVLGGVSILHLMTHIIGEHLGPDRSAKTVHQMTLPATEDRGPLDRVSLSQLHSITDHRIQKALVILDAQATRNPGISDLAQSLGLSERHFLRLFRQQVGRSPKDYLVDTKLRAAVWMLRNTRQSITSVAYDTGFSSGANLSDHCRKRLNTTPTAIRRLG